MGEIANDGGSVARIEERSDGPDGPILKIIGDLDLSSVQSVRGTVEDVVSRRPERLVFDLSELRFLDSSGITLLLTIAEQVQRVELRDPSAMVRRVIELTGLVGVFHITP